MKLEFNTANHIAELFNTVQVWTDMAQNELYNGDWKKYDPFQKHADNAMLELYETYGIDLPNRKQAAIRAAA